MDKLFRIKNLSDEDHLGNVKGSEDKKRGMIFDKNGHLKGHAELEEADPSEFYNSEDYSSQSSGSEVSDDNVVNAIAGIASLVMLHKNRKIATRDAQAEYEIELAHRQNQVQKEAVEIEEEQLYNQLQFHQKQAEIEKARIENRLYYQQEMNELEAERQQNQLEFERQELAIEIATHNERRRQRFENLMDDLEEEYLREAPDEYEIVVAEDEDEIAPAGFIEYVNSVLNKCQTGIQSPEAQGQLLEVIERSRHLAISIQRYAQICVNNGDEIPDNYFIWQKTIERLVTDRVIQGLNTIRSFENLSIEQQQTFCRLIGDKHSRASYPSQQKQIDRRQLETFLFEDDFKDVNKTAVLYCPNCGNPIDKNHAFCMNCGARLI